MVALTAGVLSATGLRWITLARDLSIIVAFLGSLGAGVMAYDRDGDGPRTGNVSLPTVAVAVTAVCTVSGVASLVSSVLRESFAFTTPLAPFVPDVIRSTRLGAVSLVERGFGATSFLLGEEIFRPRGLFLYSTSQAVAQATLVPVILGVGLHSRPGLRRLLLLACACLNTVSVVLTTTRTSTFALLVVLAVLWVRARGPLLTKTSGFLRAHRRLAVAAVLVGLVVMPLFAPAGNLLRDLVTTRSADTRADIYATTIEWWAQRPLLGWGTVVDRAGASPSAPPLGSHSQYLGVLFKQGLIGLLLFVGLIASVAAAARRALKTRQPEAAFLTGAFVVSLVASLTEELWLDPGTAVTVGLVWGLLLPVGMPRKAMSAVASASQPT